MKKDIHQEAERVLKHFADQHLEIDQLAMEKTHLEKELAISDARNTMLKEQLDSAMAGLEHYKRLCIEMSTNFEGVKSAFDSAYNSQKRSMLKAPKEPEMPKAQDMMPTNINVDTLEQLIGKIASRFGADNGRGEK